MADEVKKITGKLILIVGPSGSGKGTIIKILKDKYPNFVYPVSCTTRPPRQNEIDGEVYRFITADTFKKMIDRGEFLEYATVHSNDFYGTSKKEILEALENGKVVLREIDMQGFHSIQKLIPKENLVSIFMKVGDLTDLRQRILRRGPMIEEELQRRMDSALKEIAQSSDCAYQVDNKWGEIVECEQEVEKIIIKEIKGFI